MVKHATRAISEEDRTWRIHAQFGCAWYTYEKGHLVQEACTGNKSL